MPSPFDIATEQLDQTQNPASPFDDAADVLDNYTKVKRGDPLKKLRVQDVPDLLSESTPGGIKLLAKPVGESSKMVGQMFGFAGNVVRALPSDLAALAVGAESNPEAQGNLSTAIQQPLVSLDGKTPPPRNLPIDTTIEDAREQEQGGNQNPWASITADISQGLAKTAPKLAVLPLAGGGAAAQAFAAGGLFGLNDEGDFSPKEAVIMGLLPSVGAVARKASGLALSEAIRVGAPIENKLAQKVLEEIGHQAGLNAYMTAVELPALADMTPEERQKTIASIIGTNLAFGLLGAKNWRRDLPSETQKWIRDRSLEFSKPVLARINGELAGQLLQRNVGGAKINPLAADANARMALEPNQVAWEQQNLGKQDILELPRPTNVFPRLPSDLVGEEPGPTLQTGGGSTPEIRRTGTIPDTQSNDFKLSPIPLERNPNAEAVNPSPTPVVEPKPVEAPKIEPAVAQFHADFLNPSAKLNNNNTQIAGMAVKSIADLDAMLAVSNQAKAVMTEIKRKQKAGEPITPEEQAQFNALAFRVQLPREVIEQAANIGSWSTESKLPGMPEFQGKERPLDWKKNPEVEAWLRKNAATLWPGKPFDELAATAKVEPVEDFKKQEDARKKIVKDLQMGFHVDAAGATWKIQQNPDGTFHVEKTDRGVRTTESDGHPTIGEAQFAATQKIQKPVQAEPAKPTGEYPQQPSLPKKGEPGYGKDMFEGFGKKIDEWHKAVAEWLKSKPEGKAIVWEEGNGNVKALTRNIDPEGKNPWRVTNYWNREGAYMSTGHQVYKTREAAMQEEGKSPVKFHDKMPGRVMDEQEVQGYKKMADIPDKSKLVWYEFDPKNLQRLRERMRNTTYMQTFVLDSVKDGKIAFTQPLDAKDLEYFGLKETKPVEPSKPAKSIEPKKAKPAKPPTMRDRARAFRALVEEHGLEHGWIDPRFIEQQLDPMVGSKTQRGSQGVEIDRRAGELWRQTYREVARALDVPVSEVTSEQGRAALLEKLQAFIEAQAKENAKSDNEVPPDAEVGDPFGLDPVEPEAKPDLPKVTGEAKKLSPREAALFKKLTAKDKARREEGGPPFTADETRQYNELLDKMGQGKLFDTGDGFNLKGEQVRQEAPKKPKPPEPDLFERRRGPAETVDQMWERARKGDEAAIDDLAENFQNENESEVEYDIGRPSPDAIYTPQAFAAMFNKAFAARDFDTILKHVKATDVSVYKPFLRDLFKAQGTDPVAAIKADWMRAIFNGTRPEGATATPPPRPPPQSPPRPPPVTPNPRPRPGQPPPPRPPPSPPGPTPTRIPVAPITGGKAKSPYQIIEDFSRAIGKQIHTLRMKRGVLGFYRPAGTTTAQRFAGDLDTTAHELAGHWTDDRNGIGKPWIGRGQRSPYDTELAKFWPFGSVTPRSTLRYRRAEGIAEYIRARVMNPDMAKAEAPTFTAYFERTVTPEVLKAIDDFGTDVRTWAGADPLRQGMLDIGKDPLTFRQRIMEALRGRGFGFETGWTDKFQLMFSDPYHYAVKAEKEFRALRGGENLPSKEFETMARLLSGHDTRMEGQFENGLLKLVPETFTNAKGQLEMKPEIDPVTQRPMNLKWLMDFSGETEMAKIQEAMKQASAFMVAQRTLEKSEQLGRPNNLTGSGHGIWDDVTMAEKLLNRVAQDPALQAKLKEGARRYRMFADHHIQMLVDSGRISAGQARRIRRNNEFYVDMHRMSEQFDIGRMQRDSGNIGTAKQTIKKFKGSSLQINDVYENLLEQMNSIQREAHRNVVMNNFVDGLRQVRSMHGDNLIDFGQYGRQVRTGDRNTVNIFRNGKAEKWQFAPDIYNSLKGLDNLPTNKFFTLAMSPVRWTRFMITHGPSFIIRNVFRDTSERSVNSESGAKPWDILQGYSRAELNRYEAFGGGQFGNYIVDQHVWNREIKKKIRELSKDKSNILIAPLKLWDAYKSLAEKSEKIGRIAEFRRAYEQGKKQIAADFPGLSQREIEYNASIYAAAQARGLMDFAKAGTVMKYINQMVPFSNAGVRGLAKSLNGMKTNPGGYALRWGLHVLLPTMAILAYNRSDPERWKEYLQLPQWRRDFFWNIKVGNQWISIPRPHLLGVLAGGVERTMTPLMGEDNSFEGYGKNVANALPVNNVAELSGPLKTGIELTMNHDTFRNKDIIPWWEKDKKLSLRRGTEFASGAGQGIANALNATGLTVDSRNVDYILNSMGGFGTMTTGLTSRNRLTGQTISKSTGLFTEAPSTNARDVTWVLEWAKQNGKDNDSHIKVLKDLRKAVFDTKTAEERSAAALKLRDYASKMRIKIKKSEP